MAPRNSPTSQPITLDFVLAKSSLDVTEREQRGGREEFEFSIKDFAREPGYEVKVFFPDGNLPLQRKFRRWVGRMVRDARETLLDVYTNYGILPFVFLNILGRVKARQMIESYEMETRLRSLKKREEDAIQIKKGVELALKWLPYSPQRRKEFDRTYRAAGLLSRLADTIPQLGPRAAHRPKRPAHVMATALELYEALETLVGAPQRRAKKISYYDATGVLLHIAFPNDYVYSSNRDLGKILTQARKQRSSLKGKE